MCQMNTTTLSTTTNEVEVVSFLNLIVPTRKLPFACAALGKKIVGFCETKSFSFILNYFKIPKFQCCFSSYERPFKVQST